MPTPRSDTETDTETETGTEDAATEGRSRAEWVTLVVSCLVLVALVALILTQVGADDTPAEPVLTVGPVHAIDAQWFVDVVVTNHGGTTAANVQVIAELTIEGDTTAADQTIDFLAADEREEIVFVFDTDPAAGDLNVRVATFTMP